MRPGTYTFELERGPEYRVRTGQFTVNQGDADNKEVTLQRFVEMKQEGWWSGDLHVHRPPRGHRVVDAGGGSARGPADHLVERHERLGQANAARQLLVRFDDGPLLSPDGR